MEKVKNITKKTRIVTLVVTCNDDEKYYGLDKRHNPNVFNWVVKDEDAAREFLKKKVDSINSFHNGITAEWVHGHHARFFFGNNPNGSKVVWDYKITTINE